MERFRVGPVTESTMRHGSQINPPNRFLRQHIVPDFEHLDGEEVSVVARGDRSIRTTEEIAASIVSENDSPDIPFRYSVNPYRGCAHACPYCYARSSHEYLGLNAGLDFETDIVVKTNAADLLRAFLMREQWSPEPIVFSGVTDCYQPAERIYRLTRQCLEVATEFSLPISIITKNSLVLRDLDCLVPLAKAGLIHANVSITTLDPQLAAEMEPRATIPAGRLRAIRELTDAGIPVRVMVAPVIPGLTSHEIPRILQAAHEAGAIDARYVMLRLPLSVEAVFLEWIQRVRPNFADKVESQVRQMRHGHLNDRSWGTRMVGTGVMARQIQTMFQLFRRRLGFRDLPPLDVTRFCRPIRQGTQLRLF